MHFIENLEQASLNSKTNKYFSWFVLWVVFSGFKD